MLVEHGSQQVLHFYKLIFFAINPQECDAMNHHRLMCFQNPPTVEIMYFQNQTSLLHTPPPLFLPVPEEHLVHIDQGRVK